MPKVTVVGGGNVGAMVASYVSEMEIAEVMLIDIVEGMPQGKALDLLEGTPVRGADCAIQGSNDWGAMRSSDVVVVTAGLARKPGMSRTDLLLKNAEIIGDVATKIRELAPSAIVVMVTNPLDVMAYLATSISATVFTRCRSRLAPRARTLAPLSSSRRKGASCPRPPTRYWCGRSRTPRRSTTRSRSPRFRPATRQPAAELKPVELQPMRRFRLT